MSNPHPCIRYASAIAIVVFLALNVIAQSGREGVDETPFSTVFYMLSKVEKDDKESEKLCLASSYLAANKASEVKNLLSILDDGGYTDRDLGRLADKMIDQGLSAEANDLISLLAPRLAGSGFDIETLLRPLIRLKRDEEALRLISRLNESEKIDSVLVLADVYIEAGRRSDAAKVLNDIIPIVEGSEYREDAAEMAIRFAKISDAENANRFSSLSMKDLVWNEGKPAHSEGRILDRVIETYTILGKKDEADKLSLKMGQKPADPPTQTDKARSLLRMGDVNGARVMLESIPLEKDSETRREVTSLLIRTYLDLKMPEDAERKARTLDAQGQEAQAIFAKIADLYIEKSKHRHAVTVLDLALAGTRKIDISKPEDGRLWTSEKFDQAKAQSNLSIRYVKAGEASKALSVISAIKKPYVKAHALNQHVLAHKGKLPASKLAEHLEEALRLLRTDSREIFDARRFDVYAATARSFAEISLTDRANEVFTEIVSLLSEMTFGEKSTMGDSSLLNVMCSVGVEFELAKIKASPDLRAALREMADRWDEENNEPVN